MKRNDTTNKARRRAVRIACWARWHPTLCVTTISLAALAVVAGPAPAALVAVVVAGGLTAWSQGHEQTFNTLVVARWRSCWRRDRVYKSGWRAAMFLGGLAVRLDGDEVIPRLGRVRSTWAADFVRVRLTPAQERIDWEARAGALAQTFGALECRARALSDEHWIELQLTFRRDLPTIAAMPVPAKPNLDGLPIGRAGDGGRWLLRLTQTHVLVGGATGSGKGSVLWSILRALATWIRDGVVEAWVCDPKGGVEFGHGTIDPDTGEPTCPMFTRFARSAEQIADLLDAGVAYMQARARRLAGVARQHTPSVDEPIILIVIDELAAVVTYAPDKVRERARNALGLLLSQGRALGIHVIAAIQDPGQVKVEQRRAFPTRIALRTVDADQVDMILDEAAWVSGARCERIPHDAPGCGWVLLDGEREPTWVRAAFITDDDIAQMAVTYPAPRPTADEHNDDGDGAVEAELVPAVRGAA